MTVAPEGTGARPLEGVQATHAILLQRCGERELPAGLAVAFPRDPGWEKTLREFREVFLAGHPAFEARIVADGPNEPGGPGVAGGQLWLHLEGPEGAREYLASLLAISTPLTPAQRHQRTRWRLRRLTAPLRALPDFLILGAARCGTTSLFRYLAQHPQVVAPSRKEIGFFDRGLHRGRAWYRAHFPLRSALRGGRRTGEATPEYLLHPHAPRRVAATLPDARLVALLRDPVERAYSHYHLQVRNGYEHLSFEEALDREDERLDGELERMQADASYFSEAFHAFSYKTRGRYAEQLERWFEHVPRERLTVLVTEEFERDPAADLRRVQEFLGLAPIEPRELPLHHRAPRRPLDVAVRARLEDEFRPHNERLSELLGRDLGWDSEPKDGAR